jgi:broad specificity phosphatase PhoE
MIYIVRHGQTELNKRFALQGRSNLPLNDQGRSEAQKVADIFAAEGITISHVFSSPLERAIDTARIMAPDVPITTDDRLIEMDYGPYEGIDLTAPPQEIVTFFSDFVNNPAPKGMEPLPDVVARAGAFVESIRNISGDVLVSTHAIAMKGILEYLTPGSRGSYWSKYIGNCAVYATAYHDGQFDAPVEIYKG